MSLCYPDCPPAPGFRQSSASVSEQLAPQVHPLALIFTENIETAGLAASPSHSEEKKSEHCHNSFFFFSFAVLEFELRAFTLSYSSSPFFDGSFSRQSLQSYLPGLASNHCLPDLCLLSSLGLQE
jgi:hypothetical protein